MNWFRWLRRDAANPENPDAPDTEGVPDTAAEGVAPPLDAVALWSAFRENQVAAEARYQGRDLDLEGVVDRVDRDHRGRIRVHFKVSDYYTLQAIYPETARAEVAELRPGAKVRFAARVAGVDTGYVVVEAVGAGG